jgi:hypothetical protein
MRCAPERPHGLRSRRRDADRPGALRPSRRCATPPWKREHSQILGNAGRVAAEETSRAYTNRSRPRAASAVRSRRVAPRRSRPGSGSGRRRTSRSCAASIARMCEDSRPAISSLADALVQQPHTHTESAEQERTRLRTHRGTPRSGAPSTAGGRGKGKEQQPRQEQQPRPFRQSTRGAHAPPCWWGRAPRSRCRRTRPVP